MSEQTDVRRNRENVRLPESNIDRLIRKEKNNYRPLSSATACTMNHMAIGLYSKYKI